ncbi:MAG: hypothetical protein C4528_01440 [Gammaproteobacteria bacterium]|nr:MAG: hypothetical protein C4528_01440 [Gammaproteobacteria bacterium]
MIKNKGVLLHALLVACAVMAGWYTPSAMARHGEGDILTNRIPEPAPYVYSETLAGGGQTQNAPFENLWTTANETGSCSGCHTGLYDQWNGSMMANAWRDPGWRGAFLLVARLTSTDGCKDVKDAVTAYGGTAPDGTQAYDCTTDPATGKVYRINPFANANDTSTFNMGSSTATYSGSGSLMDDFCSRCHMPTNYVDATVSVNLDSPSGQEHGAISPTFDPTATGAATATDPFTGHTVKESFGERLDGARAVNSNSGKAGIVCEVCHTAVGSRYTPYHIYNKTGTDYFPATKSAARWDAANGLTTTQQDMLTAPDAASRNLGYAIGAGAFQLSPHALAQPERFGPLSWNNFSTTVDTYVSDVFSGGGVTRTYYFQQANPPGRHDTFYQVKFERAEFCAACHDVTNPATIKNDAGKWVGGFPIERTYTEYQNSRYADRPGNAYYDPNYKRDCQTCHMQQDFGEAGTALTLYTVSGADVIPDAPHTGVTCDRITRTPAYSHHFVGGNAYITKMIGADVNSSGVVQPYPELLETSFTSADKTSRFSNARFDNAGSSTVVATQHERFAWDRLRNALTMSFSAPASVSKPSTETLAALNIVVRNEGSGHNFPTGFPEGRAAWVAVRAFDTRNTADISDDVELMIQDAANGDRRSLGVGYLTTAAETTDPAYPTCAGWKFPEGSIDPYAFTMRALATKDGLCPTLDLPYATPVNIVTNAAGMPTDANGVVIDRNNPTGIPRYTDVDGDGDFFDDSFLKDTRLGPMRKAGTTDIATANMSSRYSVVVPSTIVGPISVSTVVYYQSFEAIVAKKFLGNLANTDDVDANEGFPGGSPTLEPCVLKGPCDRIGKAGATGETQLRTALLFDPVAVEGAPPVPVIARSTAIQVTGTTDNVQPEVIINNSKLAGQTNMTAPIPANRHWSPSPYGGATGNYASEGVGEQNVDPARIVKVSFTEPVTGVDANTFYLTDSRGNSVSALLSQIDDTTWALFPYTTTGQTFLSASTNIIHIAPSRNGSTIRDAAGNTLKTGPASGGEYTFGFKIM